MAQRSALFRFSTNSNDLSHLDRGRCIARSFSGWGVLPEPERPLSDPSTVDILRAALVVKVRRPSHMLRLLTSASGTSATLGDCCFSTAAGA